MDDAQYKMQCEPSWRCQRSSVRPSITKCRREADGVVGELYVSQLLEGRVTYRLVIHVAQTGVHTEQGTVDDEGRK